MATVQFDHRVLAWLLAFAALAAQIALGIATLLLVVPVHLAACHQAGAVVVFACALFLAHVLAEEGQPHEASQ